MAHGSVPVLTPRLSSLWLHLVTPVYAGLAYWYTLWPVHNFIFGGMLRRIATASTLTP